jgi:phenylacetate-coenzyme A ligase PaaK-like adenylate-forming protein
MEGSGSQELTPLRVAWDAWRATRGGPAAIAARQAARLEALVRHARLASRFYAEHYREVPPGPIGPQGFYHLPSVTKPELMARFDDWVTDQGVTQAGVERFVADLDNLGRDFLGRYVVFTTSGSTGVPALLVQDRRAVAVMTGLIYVRAVGAITPRLLARMLTRVPRQAAVFASGGHFLSTTMFERRLRMAPFRRRIARFFSVLDPLPKLVDQLNAFQAALLGTYATALAALTAEQEAGRLHISPLVITSGGELLTPAVQRRAEEAFGCLVNQSYAASEAMPLALPCKYGRLHLNSDWFVVEPIDTAGRLVPSGTRSDALLVTNLANYVQPVIRYQLGDSVVISDHGCACGTPLATISVEGRTDEILRFPLAGGGEAVVVPMAVATAVEEARGVRRYQVLQTAADVLTIRLDHDPGTDRAEIWKRVRARLANLLQAHGAVDVKVRLADEPPYVNLRSGKLRHVLQALPSVAFSRPMIREKDGVEQRTLVSSDARARKSECPARRIS